MASVATIGGFAFADNECNLDGYFKQVRLSERRKRLQETRVAKLSGELIYTDTTTIVQHVQALETALNADYKDFRYTVGGVLANQLLNSGDCCSGVRVLNYSLPKGTPEQLATTRTFNITLQATYDTPEEDLVSFRESLRTVGTGGPSWIVVNTFYGPRAFLQSLTTAQQYYQSGTAVGYRDYPQPPGAVNPQGEFEDRRVITRTGGRQMGNGLRFFTTNWLYVMGRDVSLFGNVDYLPASR